MSFFNTTIKSDEISINSELELQSINEPSTTTNKLYNVDGKIKWNGNYVNNVINSINTISSTSHTSIPTGTTGINIKMVGSGGGGGGQGTANGDSGGGGGSGSYTEVFLNHSTFSSTTYGSNRNNIYVSIGSGGTTGSGTNNGNDGSNTVVRFSNGTITNGTVIATAGGGYGGMSAGGSNRSYVDSVGGDGGLVGTITTGIGYTIPGRPGDNGRVAITSVNNRCGTNGGNSILGTGGKGGNERATSGLNGYNGGGGGGGYYDANVNHEGTDGGDGVVIITFF